MKSVYIKLETLQLIVNTPDLGYLRTGKQYSPVLNSRGPQPRGHGPVPVHGLLGTRPHSRRWAADEQVKLHLLLPIAPHCSHYRLNHPPTSMEKLSSTKSVPGAKKVGDHCYPVWSHQLSILYTVSIVYMCQSQSPSSSHPTPFPLGIHTFVLYICVQIRLLDKRL